MVNVYINKDKNFAFVEFRTGAARLRQRGVCVGQRGWQPKTAGCEGGKVQQGPIGQQRWGR